MKIGIDARFVGPQGTGLGKYTEKLIENLATIDKKNSYFLFLKKENWQYLKIRSRNFKKVLADIPWYSFEEQIKMPAIFQKQNLDLLHIPHFNVPVLYRGNFIVTIHDLIHHHFREESTTTRNQLMFAVKRIGYSFVIKNAVHKSKKIITPSTFVKDEIIENFKISPQKITVTYEAAEEEYFNREPSFTNRQSSLLYVGNVYPHKNLNTLLDAFKLLTTNDELRTVKLIIVCPRDIFSKRMHREIKKRGLEKKVETKGYLPPEKLPFLFRKAKAYIFPSLSEGFGIPGLNAMASGLPVLASNIPTLKEVYGDAVLYFDPKDPKDIAEKIKTILSNAKTGSDLVAKGKEQVKKYSWQKMAKLTLKVYEEFEK